MKKQLLLLVAVLLLAAMKTKAQLNVTPLELNGFSYVFGAETFDEQQFNIEGVHLTGEIVVSCLKGAISPYEIAIDNGEFQSDPIPIEHDHGNVDKNIRVRLRLGLNACETYTDSIRISCSNYDTIYVFCSGHVDKAIVAKPIFNPMQGPQHGPLQVTISCETDGAIIRYTLDENDPNEQSPEYNDTIVLSESKIIKAKAWKDDENYEPSEVATADYIIQYRIHAQVLPEGFGEIENSITPYDQYHNSGETLVLHARSVNDDYSFVNWTENGFEVCGTPDYEFVVSKDCDIKANFRVNNGNINTNVYPDGAGYVNVEGSYEIGQTAWLTAIPNNCYIFEKWDDDNRDNPRSITVESSSTYIAFFVLKDFSIVGISDDETLGHVIGGGNAFHCDQVAILEAIPEEGYEFEKWNDGNTDNPRYVEVNSDSTFRAIFAAKSIRINVIADPEDGGIVTGEGNYYFWETCTVTAQANGSYSFINWTEENVIVSTESSYSFRAGWNHDRTIVAHFAQIPIVGIVETPETICDNEPLNLVIPECINTIGGEWQLSPDTTFINVVIYDGERLIQSYNDWYLRYIAYNETDSVPSNIVSISVQSYIPENEVNHQLIAKGPEGGKYVLIYPNPKDNYKYQWYRDNTPISGANMQYYYQQGGLTEGDYKVYISYTEDRTCGAFSPAKTISNNGSISFSIYPNPAHVNDNLFVMNDSESELQLLLYSMDGRLLHSQTVTASPTAINLYLPQGIYVAYLFDETGFVKVEKIVIQ